MEKYYNKKGKKQELYGFSRGKKIGGLGENGAGSIHARTIAKKVNMWSIGEAELR